MGSSTTVESNTNAPNENSTSNNDIKIESNSKTKLKKQQKSNGTTPMSSSSSRIECPCHNFTSLSKIVDIILSEDRTRIESMIEWLDGTTDEVAIRQRKLLSCGKRFQCRYRYGTSFAILRAIRDACAPFQTTAVATKTETSVNISNQSMTASEGITNNDDSLPSKMKPSNRRKEVAPASYDQSFPPLQQHPGFSNILTPPLGKKDQVTRGKKFGSLAAGKISRKASGASTTTTVINTLQTRKKKPKRRIQPQQISTTVSTSTMASISPSSTWGNDHSSFITASPSISNQAKGRSVNAGDEDTRWPVVTAVATNTIMINALQAREKLPKKILHQTMSTTADSTLETGSIPKVGFRTPPRITTHKANVHQHHQSIVKSEKDAVVRTATKKKTKVRETAVEQMERLVDIYIALIKNILVPSTPLEVHLLIELLSIDTSTISSNSSRDHMQQDNLDQSSKIKGKNEALGAATGSTLFFQPIFYDPERCIRFAQSALTKLQKTILQRLSPFLIKSLLQDSIFVQRCPALAKRLHHLLEGTTTTEWTPPSSELVTGTHAIFSLPFEPDRDSRHNFKTAAEQSMYQNREVTRDAFLSELRVFITAKSKVFLPQQVNKVRETAQYESRKIIGNISSHNVLWFAQFFCELLLQVGLAPVDEMDQELLKIVADDRDKLQKLHKRFSKKIPSRASQARAGFASTATATGRRNERYRNHNNTNNNKSWMTSTFQESLSYFPGYQEFFFIFLYSVNSYNFGIHLLHQVVEKMSGMISNHSLSGLEKRMLELALLGRFLGFLVFSPNWQEEGIDLNKLKPCICSLDYGLNLLESVGLPLPKIVQEAWDGGYIFLTIPWVTELLKMSKWDSISQSSMNYRQILANLRLVQSYTSQPSPEEIMGGGSHLQLLSFHLETFFNDTFSLPKLTSLPDATIARNSRTNPDSLDNQKIGLSTAAIYASSPHMENLCDMITNMTKKKTRHEIKRKLRPSIVTTAVGTEAQSYLGAELPREKVMSPLSKTACKGSPLDKSAYGKKIHAQNKLMEGFFHQHRDLKEICDFAVDQTLKTLLVEEIHVFVVQAAHELNIGIQSTETEIEEMEIRAFQSSRDLLRNKLTTKLTKSLELFCHHDMQTRVIDVAIQLSTVRGMESSQPIVRGLISSSTKIVLKDPENNKNAPNGKKEETKTEIDHAIEAATSSIRNLQNDLCKVDDAKTNTRLIEEALACVETLTKSVLIPRENLLREFFDCILDLEAIAESIINQVLEFDTPELWITFCAFFRLLEHLARISGYWRSRISNLFGEDFFIFIKNSKLPSPSERKIMLEQLTRSATDKNEFSGAGKGIKNDRTESIYTGIMEPVAIQFSE